MKILHTSDWHLGHILYNYDRTQEQLCMLEQMVNIVKEQKPDVFLLCGDVYHTPQPSAAVQTMLTNALLNIHKAQPEMVIVVTVGNHDIGNFPSALERTERVCHRTGGEGASGETYCGGAWQGICDSCSLLY